MIKLVLLSLIMSCKSVNSRNENQGIRISLEEVGVEGNLITKGNRTVFDPYMVSFIFEIHNKTDSLYYFQSVSNNKVNHELHNGIFKIIQKEKVYMLYSGYDGFEIKEQSSATVLAELRESEFFNDLPKSGYEKLIFDYIIKSKIEYQQENSIITVFVPDDLTIYFNSEGQIIKTFPSR